jgi:hypothetical protein
MPKPTTLKTDFRRHDRWLVVAMILGPLAALTNLTVSYVLMPESCMRGSKAILHATSATFFVLTLVAAAIAWRIRAAFGSPAEDDLHERTHWMANASIVLALSSALLVIAMEIPNLILRSCD